MKKLLNIPNVLSASRIIICIYLMIYTSLNSWFYFLYIFSGLTDILDGYIARRYNQKTNLGEYLDSIADLVFAIMYVIKILPMLNLSVYIIVFIVLIGIIKILNYILKCIRNKSINLHNKYNKTLGLGLFVLPFIKSFVYIVLLMILAICSVAFELNNLEKM